MNDSSACAQALRNLGICESEEFLQNLSRQYGNNLELVLNHYFDRKSISKYEFFRIIFIMYTVSYDR